ncbi:hypothetical protein ACWJJH_04060 [Endozoicomonadaceae bacterium StTr2]
MFNKTSYPHRFIQCLILCISLGILSIHASTSKVTVTVVPLIHALKIHFSCSSAALIAGEPVVSEEFDYLERKATLHIYPAGTADDSAHVGVELHIKGKYTEQLSPYLNALIIETRSEHCTEDSKQIVAFKPASIDESDGDCFVVRLTDLIPVESINRHTNEAIFTIRPILKGYITAHMQRRECEVKWQVPRHDIAMMKRADFILVSPDVEIQSASAGHGPNLHMELSNKGKYPSRNRITFRIYQGDGSGAHLPFKSYELFYEGVKQDVSLASGSFKASQPNNIDLEREVGNAISATNYKDVLAHSKQASVITFTLRLTLRNHGGGGKNLVHSEKKFCELHELTAPALSVVTTPAHRTQESGLLFVSYIGCDFQGIQSDPFDFHGQQYRMTLVQGGGTVAPDHIVLSLNAQQQQEETTTGGLKGFVATHHRVTAKHELTKAHEKATPVYTALPQPGVGSSDQSLVSVVVVPEKAVNKDTGLAEFVLRPVYSSAMASTTRPATDTRSSPFITAIPAGIDYTMNVRRYDMSLLGHCEGFTITSADIDTRIKLELKPEARNPGMLVMVISDYPDDENHGDYTIWYDAKAGQRQTGLVQLASIRRSDMRGGRTEVQLDSVDKILSSAHGDSVRFIIKTEKKVTVND